ncbi:hypothetical protein BD324DRAFT_615485 [Kockovaella imperatae]|uniref:HTH APSES-type domain-containing protein n=1 Tax=Kockovaella imperatae TaxID=4999 RepID=A0A1Y1UPF4_9TREE|nr:hypothetical protein BD324DRAFT_615485 [Kockovaella imperatae]ORX39911.1 hypothetical protein BD324DRAFT_615485 [Kockovaella imperatae]
MPHAATNTIDSDIVAFANSNPPPPYPGSNQYDLTPTPYTQNRPRLPEERRNLHLTALPEDAKIVKFQTIVREGKEIVVGRIKVPTTGPNAHAFILRRYDTNAVSLTTMFKVAFPGATDEEERREMDWVRSSYDIRDTNGGRGCDAVRLAGQWVSRHLAIHLAPAYNISELVAALARAVPDPNVAYRKSQRSQAAAEEMSRQKPEVSARTNTVVPSMSNESASPAPKRQRRQSAQPVSDAVDTDAGSRHLTLEAVTTVTAPTGAQVDMEAEIQSAKQLVMDLKRELNLRAAAGEELEDQGADVAEGSRGTKRSKGSDEGVAISGGAGKDRIIRRSKRVEQTGVAQTARQVAWGALIFGLGVGAALSLPQLAAQFL